MSRSSLGPVVNIIIFPNIIFMLIFFNFLDNWYVLKGIISDQKNGKIKKEKK